MKIKKNKTTLNLDLKNLSPISISVYTRINHFKNCIKSLLKNDLAKHSILYIFSDAAKPGDEESVFKVREYAKSIKGFKKVNLIFQKKNNFKKNMQDFIQKAFEINGKNIILEDDIIVAKHFLRYMNEGLNKYEHHPKVYSVSGYFHPINHNVKDDYLFLRRMDGWSLGLWSKKYRKIKKKYSSKDLVSSYVYNWNMYKKLCDLSPNMITTLIDLSLREHQPDDYFGLLYFIKYDKFGLYPTKSLARNMGHDGSGVNCNISNKYKKIKIYQGKINLNKEVIVKSNLAAEIKIGKYFYPKKYKSLLYFFFNLLKYQFPKLRKFLKNLIKSSDIQL